MALVGGIWLWDLRPSDNLVLSFLTKPTDTVAPSETTVGNVEQPIDEQTGITDELPLPVAESDEIIVQDAVFGIVKGDQKTIYITDERYLRPDIG